MPRDMTVPKGKTYDWHKRPVSWSMISSFMYDPEQWFDKYIKHGPCTKEFCFIFKLPSAECKCPISNSSKEMEFGKFIGKKLETDPKFLPQIPRHSRMEHPFENIKFGKLTLVGYLDTFCDKTFKKIGEFKTGKKPWDQTRADNHGQLTMYCLMNYLVNKIRPEDTEIFLAWMPTQDNSDFSISFVEPIEKNIRIFKTKRTMMDILQFGKIINNVYKQMEEYEKIKKWSD